jgi:hypothetical protein
MQHKTLIHTKKAQARKDETSVLPTTTRFRVPFQASDDVTLNCHLSFGPLATDCYGTNNGLGVSSSFRAAVASIASMDHYRVTPQNILGAQFCFGVVMCSQVPLHLLRKIPPPLGTSVRFCSPFFGTPLAL